MYCYARYLSAKKSVDDRALNRYVFEQFVERLPDVDDQPNRPLAVIEAGCGVGTMVERLLEWGAFEAYLLDDREGEIKKGRAVYTAVDQLETNIQVLDHRLGKLDLPERLTIEPVAADIYSFISQCEQAGRQFDVLIANAFLDLFDPADIITRLFTLLRPGGIFYFTINFDGVTSFEPTIDRELDALIERCYHETMDARMIDGRPSGDSRSGRHVLGMLRELGGEIVAAGSSDWVVHRLENGYPQDEDYFLHFIVDTVENALKDHPEIDPKQLKWWGEVRHNQIDSGELIYITHQQDMLGYIAEGMTKQLKMDADS